MTGLERVRWLVSCEHGGNRVPKRFSDLLDPSHPVLQSHRGYDLGAADWATVLAQRLATESLIHFDSRLLIDLNRSLHHPHLLSSFTRGVGPARRRDLIESLYEPHRTRVATHIEHAPTSALVVHIAAHSFVPTLDGRVRDALVGLLYDPGRPYELALCRQWQHSITARLRRARVRRNYPYRGAADGFTTALRRVHSPSRYCGIELEINQCTLSWSPARQAALQRVVADALLQAAGRVRTSEL